MPPPGLSARRSVASAGRCDVAAQALELFELGAADGDAGMQGEAARLREASVRGRLEGGRQALQGEHFLPGMRAACDAVGDRVRQQVIDAGAALGIAVGIEGQVGLLGLAHEEAAALERATDLLGDLLHQALQLLGAWRGQGLKAQ